MKLKASFTIEAAFVMSIIFFCIATVILFAYLRRDIVFKDYISQQAAIDAAYTEEKWKSTSTLESVEERANTRLHQIGRYSADALSASRNELKKEAGADFDNEKYSFMIPDIENYMRITAVICDFMNAGDQTNE